MDCAAADSPNNHNDVNPDYYENKDDIYKIEITQHKDFAILNQLHMEPDLYESDPEYDQPLRTAPKIKRKRGCDNFSFPIPEDPNFPRHRDSGRPSITTLQAPKRRMRRG